MTSERTKGLEYQERKHWYGFMLKQQFFEMIKPDAGGHAGRGIITFSEAEKPASGGFDAVVIIDCPYEYPNTKKLVSKLVWFNEQHFR